MEKITPQQLEQLASLLRLFLNIESPLPEKPAIPERPLRNMFGINVHEWNFLQDPNKVDDGSKIFEPKTRLIEWFENIRQYLDWEQLEDSPNVYTFNPARRGGWNYDVIYERLKKDDKLFMTCIKEAPNWMFKTYPAGQRDTNAIPVMYGSDPNKPGSYIQYAQVGFQYAARYGKNKDIDPKLLLINTKPRWTADPVNEIKIGLGYADYVECDNERDKNWSRPEARSTPQMFAAQMSAFYDGHKGTMGPRAGVKTADPSMKVVMGGLAHPNVQYVRDMIAWCKENRGLRPDGSIDLCFDVINYHQYANNSADSGQWGNATRGKAPELTPLVQTAKNFVALGKEYTLPVWVSETGYDVLKTPQSANPIGDKSALEVQADWLLRTSLMYARLGIDRVFFYQFVDDNPGSGVQYSSSGMATSNKEGTAPRPSLRFVKQVTDIIGDYSFNKTINESPRVDEYILGDKKAYVLYMETENNSKANYTLPSAGTLYTLQPNSDTPQITHIEKSYNVSVTERPVIVTF